MITCKRVSMGNSIYFITHIPNLTHKFVKIRQREGSGTAKKLEESISTAPSGFFLQQAFSNFIDQRHFHVSHAGRHYYTLSFCFFPWSVPIGNSRNFLRPAALPLPACFKNYGSSIAM